MRDFWSGKARPFPVSPEEGNSKSYAACYELYPSISLRPSSIHWIKAVNPRCLISGSSRPLVGQRREVSMDTNNGSVTDFSSFL
jgi:hypothetical protein